MSEPLDFPGDPAAAETLAEEIADAPDESLVEPVMRRSLWRHADYMKVWTAATVSLLGTQVSQLAIPFIAAVILRSSPFEVAMLGAIQMAPFLLFALPAGAWLDRMRRRPVMITGDLGRGLALLTIPVAYAAGVLTIWQLYAVSFVAGTLTVLFDVADQSYLPALLERDELVEGNAKLSIPQSSAQVLGPAFAGGLIGLVSGPFAVIADAISFFVSGGLIALIRKPERRPERVLDRDGKGRSLRAEIAEGLHFVVGNPYLRRIAAATATANLGSSMAFSIFAIFFYIELGLRPELVGAIFGLGGFGVLVGALLAGRVSDRLGLGPTIVGSVALSGPATLMIALLPRDPFVAGAILLASGLITGAATIVYNVSQVSFRQAICPLEMQGRMNATMRFIVWGTFPLGALAGGLLATFIPLRATIAIGACVESASFLWVLLSPVRSLRVIPTGPDRSDG